MRVSLKKREKFVVAALFVTLLFLIQQFLDPNLREKQWYIMVAGSLLATIWSLWGSWEGVKIIPLLVLPTAFPLGLLYISTLIQTGLISTVLLSIILGFSLYCILLIENIYAVSTIRTIPLIRAAHTVGFLYTLITSLLLFHTIFSFHWSPWFNGGVAFLITLPLCLQSLWVIELEETISEAVLFRSFISALTVGEIAISLGFWPANSAMKALFLTSFFYTVVGVFQHEMQDKMRGKYTKEYFLFGLGSLIIFFVTTSWQG